jgi:hypothetical protein
MDRWTDRHKKRTVEKKIKQAEKWKETDERKQKKNGSITTKSKAMRQSPYSPLKPEICVNNILKRRSYITGNTTRLHYTIIWSTLFSEITGVILSNTIHTDTLQSKHKVFNIKAGDSWGALDSVLYTGYRKHGLRDKQCR